MYVRFNNYFEFYNNGNNNNHNNGRIQIKKQIKYDGFLTNKKKIQT